MAIKFLVRLEKKILFDKFTWKYGSVCLKLRLYEGQKKATVFK